MRVSSLRYLSREGLRNIWQNRFMAIASVGVLVSCLLLTGGAYLVFVNLNRAFQWAYSQNVVIAYADPANTESETLELGEKIRAVDNVAGVEFLSREQLLLKYKDTIPETLYEEVEGENNPFPDAYVITFKDLSRYEATLKQIQRLPGLESTSYDQDIAAAVTRIRHLVLVAGGWIILMLFLVSLFIIANTIKLTVYNRRLEISIMKSVGATNAFVRVPFVIEGVVLGLAAGGFAYGILWFIYSRLSMTFQTGFGFMSGLVRFSAVWPSLLAAFLLIGIFTGALGSAISMRKYLRDEGGISGVI